MQVIFAREYTCNWSEEHFVINILLLFFPKPCWSFGGNINVKVNLSNYVTKTGLKNATEIDLSKLAAKTDLVSLKAEVDKLDINRLKTVPVDLSKLSNVVNDVVKKVVYKKFVTKRNNIDTSKFVLKTKCDTDKSDLEKRISDVDETILNTSGLVKEIDCNAEISEIEGKILSIKG